MADAKLREHVAKYLNEYYGFSPELEKELGRHSSAIDAKARNELNKHVDTCITDRSDPPLEGKPVNIESVGETAGELPSSMDTKSRYVLFQLIKKVTASRLAAISEAARPDRTIDVNALAKALSTREKGAPAEIAKELKPLLGSQPTIDIAARVLVGLDMPPFQPQTSRSGYWRYICRGKCCFWGWRCSWGCLLIGCKFWG